MDFAVAIEAWKAAAAELAKAEGAYARAFGAALAKADGKTEAIRQGQAEQVTEAERTARDLARVEEQAARWAVQYALAVASRDARAA